MKALKLFFVCPQNPMPLRARDLPTGHPAASKPCVNVLHFDAEFLGEVSQQPLIGAEFVQLRQLIRACATAALVTQKTPYGPSAELGTPIRGPESFVVD